MSGYNSKQRTDLWPPTTPRQPAAITTRGKGSAVQLNTHTAKCCFSLALTQACSHPCAFTVPCFTDYRPFLHTLRPLPRPQLNSLQTLPTLQCYPQAHTLSSLMHLQHHPHLPTGPQAPTDPVLAHTTPKLHPLTHRHPQTQC